MRKIFTTLSVVLTTVCSLHSYAGNTSADDYVSGSPCPKHGCDQQLHGGVEIKAAGTGIEGEIIGVENENFNYSVRDYFARSIAGHLTVDIYGYWGEVSFSTEMLSAYIDFYASGFKEKTHEMMYSTGVMEDVLYVDKEMYDNC